VTRLAIATIFWGTAPRGGRLYELFWARAEGRFCILTRAHADSAVGGRALHIVGFAVKVNL
jgi:hypothetical protein